MSCDSKSTAEQPSASQNSQNIAEGHEAGNLQTLTGVLSVMAHTRLLPVPAWSLCKSLHQTVRPVVRLRLDGQWPPATKASAAQAFVLKCVVKLALYGPFDADPLLALAASPVTSASSADGTDNFNAFFRNVKAMKLSRPGVALAHMPRSLQQLHLEDCDHADIVAPLQPLNQNQIQATHSGLQSEVPTTPQLSPLHNMAAHLPAHVGGSPSALRSPSLSRCTSITSLPDSIGGLTALTALSLTRCTQLIRLPDSIGELAALTALRLCSCKRLTGMPNSIGGLTQLTAMSLRSCRQLVHLPSEIGGLTALASLDLRDCASLAAVPETIGGLSALTSLDLGYCSELTRLPVSLGSLTALATLQLSSCARLRRLPDSIGGLTALTALDLSDCSSLQVLPDAVAQLPALAALDLWRCRSLCRVPADFGALRLEMLGVGCLGATGQLDARGLLTGLSCLATLTYLDLCGCGPATFPAESISNMMALQRLDLTDTDLPAMPEVVCTLAALMHLIMGSSSWACLPDAIGELRALTLLDLGRCRALTCLPDSIGKLRALTQLTLAGCCALVALPESIGGLTALTALNLSFCEALTQLPERIGELAALEEVSLHDCRGLRSLPDTLVRVAQTGEIYAVVNRV
eukprot:TRINITY_DN8332_c1_g1_i4.p1 TRINITY_DN8332_c1_g1~~TRINITY_DN8332_c1_g1_i4.p1  ORF type:complete len:649 (-),score=139.31 TRINITY_DN8332_c1_g1_i4:334-2235(-)